MSIKEAFELMKFYEDAAERIKSRVWILTTWILTLCTGLIAFSADLYVSHNAEIIFRYLIIIASLAGIALCIYLYILITDQGQHLQGAFKRINRIMAWNPHLNGLLEEDEPSKVRKAGYKIKKLPRFCRRLRVLSLGFALGFVIIVVLVIFLV